MAEDRQVDRASLGRVTVVLVEPRQARNVGAVARAMANTGFSSLTIVRREPMSLDPGRRLAVGATHILDAALQVPDLGDAVGEGVFLVGTTNRPGKRRGPLVAPRVAAPAVADLARQGPVALLFGPEDRGLSTELLDRCGLSVRIPSAPEQPSYNLAQATLLVLYAIWREVLDAREVQGAQPGLAAGARRAEELATVRDLLATVAGPSPAGARSSRLAVTLERLLLRARPNTEELVLLRQLLQRCLAAHGGSVGSATSGGLPDAHHSCDVSAREWPSQDNPAC